MTTRALIIFVTASVLCALNAQADVFVLNSGGRIEGERIRNDDPNLEGFYLVKTSLGGKIMLAKAQVDHVLRLTEAEREYEARLADLPDTPDDHWKMAEWCRANGLNNRRQFHLEQVIKHDPGHAEARYGLGYSQVDGRWVRVDEWNISRGYVRHRGGWRLPQEVMLEEAAEKVELAEKKWYKDLKIWSRWINKTRHHEAIRNIESINDPLAAMALGKLLEEETDRTMKLTYIEALGRLKSPKGNIPLMKLAIEDDSQRIRDACLDQLVTSGPQQATSNYLRMLAGLKNSDQIKDNVKINRVAIALGRMKDPAAIRPLIDFLVTEHKQTQGGGQSSGGTPIAAGFGGSSPGSFNFGSGKKKAVKVPFQNEGVLNALRALTGGEHHGFNVEEWTNWYVEANTPKHLQLRRDD